MYLMNLKFILIIFIVNYNLAKSQWEFWGNYPLLEPKALYYPNNIDDVIAIIKAAYDNNCKIRAIGSCHSWNNLINTDGYIINTDNLNKVLKIDLENKRVKVECGIKLKDLFYILAQENLAFANQGFIDQQSVAGAISTGTHGTGHEGCLSDFIVEMEVIDCFGNLHKISEENNKRLSTLRVSLGALGFIYSVTIECKELFKLNHKRVITTFDEAVKNYKYNHENNDYYMFMVHLKNDIALNFFWNKTSDNIKRRVIDIKENIINNKTISKNFGAPIINYSSNMGNTLLKIWFYGMQTENIEYSYISLSPLKDPISTDYYIEAEYAIDFNDFEKAIQDFKEFYKDYKSLTALITCRFAPNSDKSYLSMAYDRDTAYININIINYFDNYIDFFQKFEDIFKKYNARPHWGKFNLLNKSDVERLYNKGFKKFNKLRSILDPKKMFSNNFIERYFG